MSLGPWKRVNRLRLCVVCGKSDWCLYHEDGSASICPRTSDGYARDLGEAGCLFLHKGDVAPPRGYIPKPFKAFPRPEPEPQPGIDWDALVADCENRARGQKVKGLATKLGVSVRALRRLHLGLSAKGAWTFPMYDECGRVNGIRLRGDDGRKWAVKGSHNGVFVPTMEHHADPLMICEGPTDTAALLGLDYCAIGRPSCSGGGKYILPYCYDRHVVIVADHDGPGLNGARKLADRLWAPCGKHGVKVITPLRGKDVREWIQGGATRTAVDAVVGNAPFHSMRKEDGDG